MKDNNIYIKEGEKYTPIGITLNQDWLSDGIWYVKHYDYSQRISNFKHIFDSCGIKKISECPEKINMKKIIQQYEFAEDILSSKEFNDWLNNNGEVGYTITDLVHKIIEIIINKNKENKENVEF